MTRPYSISRAAQLRIIERDQTSDKDYSAQALAKLTCANIREYFTQEMWNAWVDAGPENVFKFVEYAQTEQERITAELVKVTEWLAPAPVVDPRDDDQKAWDAFCAEVEDTNASTISNTRFGSRAWFAGIDPEEF